MQWVPFLLYVFVSSFTPGPNNILSLTYASRYGYRKTLGFILGVMTGTAIISIGSSYLNLLLVHLLPKMELGMRLLGALYMLYLAIKIMRNHSKATVQSEEKANFFLSGLILQFINPKVIIYAITTISTFIIPVYHSNASLLLFSLFLGFVGFLSTSSWAIFGALFQNLISKYQRAFQIGMGLLLLYSAISIVFPV